MSKLIKYVVLVISLTANTYSFAQSSLPNCEGEYNATTWTDCFGSRTTDGGNSYVGEYKNGKANGFGTFTFADGRKYVGSYDMGKRNGVGKEYGSDGKLLINGEWTNGQLTNTFPIQSNATTTVVDETKVTPKTETQADSTVDSNTTATEEVVTTETKSEVVNEVKEEVKKEKIESNTNNFELYFFIGMGALVALLIGMVSKLLQDKLTQVKPASLKKQFNEIKTELKNESINATTTSVSKNDMSVIGKVVVFSLAMVFLGGVIFAMLNDNKKSSSLTEKKKSSPKTEVAKVLEDKKNEVKEEKKSEGIFTSVDGMSDGHDLQLIYADNNSYYLYIELKSLSKDGDIAKAWTIFDFKGDLLSKMKSSYSSQSSKMVYEFDCINKNLRIPRTIGYAKGMLNGNVVSDDLASNNSWNPVPVNSTGEKAMNIICQFKDNQTDTKKSNTSKVLKEKKNESDSYYTSESHIRSVCSRYKTARNECAVASNVQKCVEIKIGSEDAVLASSSYCDDNGDPNLWLFKK